MKISYEIPIIPDDQMYAGAKNIKEEDIKNALLYNIKTGKQNVLKLSNITINGFRPDKLEYINNNFEYIENYEFINISRIDVDNMKIFVDIDEKSRLKDFFDTEFIDTFNCRITCDTKGACPIIYYNKKLSRIDICDFQFTVYDKRFIDRILEICDKGIIGGKIFDDIKL